MTKTVKRIIGAISLAAYAYLQTLTYPAYVMWQIALTIVVAAVCGALVAPAVCEYFSWLFDKWGHTTFAIALSLFAIYTTKVYLGFVGSRFMSLVGVIAILSIPALAAFYMCAGRFLIQLVIDVFEGTSITEKREYVIISILMSLLVFWCYISSSLWFHGLDVVLGSDSSHALDHLYIEPAFFDIRHPIVSIFFYPIGVAASTINKFITPLMTQGMDIAFLIALVHIQAIMIVGMMLRNLTGDRRMLRFYMACTGPFMMCVEFDKFPILVMLLAAYVFYALKGHTKRSAVLICAAAGGWFTSAGIGLAEVFEERPVKEKVKRILLIIVGTAASWICVGRLSVLMDVNGFVGYAGASMNIRFIDGLRSYTNVIVGGIIPLDAHLGGWIKWEDTMHGFPELSYVIALLMLIAVIADRREKRTMYFVSWLFTGFILFVVFKWAAGAFEAPLFSFYYTWAVAPLLLSGFRRVMRCLGWNEEIAIDIVSLGMVTMNLAQVVVITKYLMLMPQG